MSQLFHPLATHSQASRRLFTFTLACLLIAGYVVTTPTRSHAFQGPPGGGRMGGPNLEVLTTRLKLTADQQEKIKPILANRDKQSAALREDESLEMQDRMAKMMKIRSDVETKITAILTEDQKTEYAKMNAEMRQRRGPGGPGGGPGGLPPTNPPPTL